MFWLHFAGLDLFESPAAGAGRIVRGAARTMTCPTWDVKSVDQAGPPFPAQGCRIGPDTAGMNMGRTGIAGSKPTPDELPCLGRVYLGRGIVLR